MNHFNNLPNEVQHHIMNQIPLSSLPSTMLVNKSFNQLNKINYCHYYEPTPTQILNYINQAKLYKIPYVHFELRKHNDNYIYIVKLTNETICMKYHEDVDDFTHQHIQIIDSITKNGIELMDYILYAHYYSDLDLLSLYQLWTSYCGQQAAKNLVYKKINNIVYYANQFRFNLDTQVDLIIYYLYLASSAILLKLINDIQLPLGYFEDIIEDIKIISQLLYQYFDINI
jgi:hypothetical protein